MGSQALTSKDVPISSKGFNGGLNDTASPLTVAANESSKLQNIDFDKFGSVVKRNGYLNINTTQLNDGAMITGLHWYMKRDGTDQLIVTCGDKVYTSLLNDSFYDISGTSLYDDEDRLLYDDSGVSFLNATAFSNYGSPLITPDALFQFITFLDKVFMTNGVDNPLYWDGTGVIQEMTLPTNIKHPKFIRQFMGYVFLADSEVNGVRQGSRLNWSTINSADVWLDSDFAYISWNDGEDITGIEVLGDRIVIFKDRSIWIGQFTGDVDIPFQFQRTQSHVGCVSGYSIQNVANSLVFMSEDGLYMFDGNQSQKLSNRINDTFYGGNLVVNKNSVSMYQKYKNRTWWSNTISGTVEASRVIMWDDYNNAFSIYSGMNPSAMCMAYSGGRELPIFGDYNGMVYRADQGLDDYKFVDGGIAIYDDDDVAVFDDDDVALITDIVQKTAVDAYWYSKWIDYDDLVNQKGIIQLDCYYQFNPATLSVAYSYNFEDIDTYTLPINTSGGTDLWDFFNWDVGRWASAGGGHYRLDLTGRGRVVRIGFKNNILSETFRVDGIGQLVHLETNQ